MLFALSMAFWNLKRTFLLLKVEPIAHDCNLETPKSPHAHGSALLVAGRASFVLDTADKSPPAAHSRLAMLVLVHRHQVPVPEHY